MINCGIFVISTIIFRIVFFLLLIKYSVLMADKFVAWSHLFEKIIYGMFFSYSCTFTKCHLSGNSAANCMHIPSLWLYATKNQQTSFIEFKESIDHFWSRQQENMLHNHLEVWSKTINMLFLIDFYKIHTNIINLSPKVPFKNSNRDARSIKPVHVTRVSIYQLVKKKYAWILFSLN